MSNFGRRVGARVRRRYTGELLQTAMQGITRHGQLGLDECSPEQLKLRVLLALHLFNLGETSALHSTAGSIGILSHYTITVSPRYDDLVMITDVPENVTNYLAPHGHEPAVPGVRMLGCDNHEYRMVHLPTGARLRVTGDPGCHIGRPFQHRRTWWTPDKAMTPEEVDSMAGMPVPTPDAAMMIAALVTRFNCVDAEKAWSGSWWTDRLNRDLPELPRHNIRRQLAGGGSQWMLRWIGYPHANDLARMICDPVFGVRGAVVHEALAESTCAGATPRFACGKSSPFASLQPYVDFPRRVHIGLGQVAVGEARHACWGRSKPRRCRTGIVGRRQLTGASTGDTLAASADHRSPIACGATDFVLRHGIFWKCRRISRVA